MERVYKTKDELELLKTGAWRPSAILDGPDLEENTAWAKDWNTRPPWGKGEVVISALRREAMMSNKSKRKPTEEEEAFRRADMSQRLASVQAELQSTYIARQFKKHLESEGSSCPEFLKGVKEPRRKTKPPS